MKRGMKAHIFFTSGLLIAAIFFMSGLEALHAPGFGLLEIYVFGGFIIAALLIRAGWIERKAE